MVAVGAIRGSDARFRSLGTLFGILALVLMLVALLYVMGQLPVAVNLGLNRVIGSHGMTRISYAGFWGSLSYPVATGTEYITYGAGWAWYAGLAASALFLAGSVLLARGGAQAPTSPATPRASLP